jgi:gliding motility-associated protein GldM
MAEQLAIEIVSGRATVQSFSFNKIIPLAFSKSSYINQGDSLDLKIMIAAFDSTEAMNLEYYIDDTAHAGDPLSFSGEPGDALTLSGGVGTHYVEGTIEVKEKGAVKKKPWTFNYSVGAPTATIAAADLAVLYKNWDNRIKVSASGYDPSSVSVTCSGCSGSLKKEGDFYIAKAGSGKIATIKVSAKTDDGKSVALGQEEFRIFPLPKPSIFFGGKSGGSIAKVSAAGIPKLIAKLENSPLNVKYTVSKYSFFTVKNGQPITMTEKSNKITPKIKAAIGKMAKRSNLTFSDIYVKGPGGKESKIDGGLVIKLK